jgi:hypothetical protein
LHWQNYPEEADIKIWLSIYILHVIH